MPIEIIDGHPIQGTLKALRLVCDGLAPAMNPAVECGNSTG